jgi:hypothetical protein
MKTSFSQYLAEAISNIDDAKKTISDYFDKGEIVKPEYERVKYDINHIFRKKGDDFVNKVLLAMDHDTRDSSPEWTDLYYGFPRSMTELLSFKKKLAKAKKEHGSTDLVKQCEDYVAQFGDIAEKFKELKDKIVTTAAKRAEVKAVKAAEVQKKFTDSSTLVNVLVEHLEEYAARAVKMAGEQYDANMDFLKKHDWNLDKAAPLTDGEPSWSDKGRRERERREWFLSLTEANGTETNKRTGDKIIRKASAKIKKAYQDESERNARASYMAWVQKMIEKIGKPVVKAKATGNPWNGSVLEVETDDGGTQRWKTQMILNTSKYGKLFNQFPSRKMG